MLEYLGSHVAYENPTTHVHNRFGFFPDCAFNHKKQEMTMKGFATVDYVIVVGYLFLIAAIGSSFYRRKTTAKEFFSEDGRCRGFRWHLPGGRRFERDFGHGGFRPGVTSTTSSCWSWRSAIH